MHVGKPASPETLVRRQDLVAQSFPAVEMLWLRVVLCSTLDSEEPWPPPVGWRGWSWPAGAGAPRGVSGQGHERFAEEADVCLEEESGGHSGLSGSF